jgi:hypothetical protein
VSRPHGRSAGVGDTIRLGQNFEVDGDLGGLLGCLGRNLQYLKFRISVSHHA